MSNVEFGPLNVELRVKEMELLEDAFFNQLIDAPSIEEALKSLQGTPYESVKESTQIESALTKDLTNLYAEMFDIVPNQNVVEFASLKYAYHNLKVLFKNYYQEVDLMHLIIPIGKYAVEELDTTVRTGQSSLIDKSYLKAIHNVQTYMEETNKLQHVDILLDYEYLNHLYQLALNIDGPIVDWTKRYIDLNKIIIAFRLLKLNKPVSSLSGLIPDIGYLSIEEIIESSKNGSEALTSFLLDSEYGEALSQVLNDEQIVDPILVEKQLDNYFMQQLESAKFESFGELPLLAYLYAKETEIKNLRVVLNGIKNRLPKEMIMDTLRETFN